MPLTWHTFLYMYFLILSYAIIWKLEKSETALQKRFFTSKIPSILAFLPIFSMFLVGYDILIGIAPLINLVNLAPAIACLVGIIRISQNPFNLKSKISLLTIILIVLCSLSAAVHLLLG